MPPDVDLTPAEPGDRAYVESLLEVCGLPTADLETALTHLFVCEAEHGRVGVGGLEPCGGYALLRSVAVEPSARGTGYGTVICEALLDRARAGGVSSVFLLTTTAADFFDERGFDRVDRVRPRTDPPDPGVRRRLSVDGRLHAPGPRVGDPGFSRPTASTRAGRPSAAT